MPVYDGDDCPKCGTRIKYGAFKSNIAYNSSSLALINAYAQEPWSDACATCGKETLDVAAKRAEIEVAKLTKSVPIWLASIPVLTLPHPVNWQYQPIDMVTAQATLGTGLFTELASSLSDLVGGVSNAYGNKVREGERICKNALRSEAVKLGANAILAVDIDYSEVGGAKAMALVCMTGTAVRASPECLPAKADESADLARRGIQRLAFLTPLRGNTSADW